ncbi:Cof-type HAD-IIB family hydrolase [Guptibacillus hwajinpoensis]|uniref:Cof-type HAD-IIB family hydrolase n=1 Tax=Guptibacillus hwajinpoensis TaxID=208199 RepID=UPI001CFEACBF|nr:Cof-type HAD-IIB family hydrolase [Pseudalkalibacillus hwajinpoensis]WLR58455.1 Cof-type HAD-IIB family hydrolase [Pseudalkalibacillus hwajinpoensis]
MVYQLLALDIDGTLLRSNHKIDKETKDAISYVREKGVYVTLTTSRNFASAKKIAKAVKLDDVMLVTHSGAFIAEEVEEPVYEERIPNQDVRKIVKILEGFDCHIRIIHERLAVGNRVKHNHYLSAKMTLGIGDPLFYPVNFVETLSEYLEKKDLSPPKIDAHFFNEEEREEARLLLEEQIPSISVVRSTKCNFGIIPKGVSKAKGLRILGERLGVSVDQMVVIGDADCDAEMIRQAGLGVAMGNASYELKRLADWVTRSNDQQGVSYMVKEVFRRQMRVQLKR